MLELSKGGFMATILIVEDEANIARFLQAKLAHEGFSVHSVRSGADAFAFLGRPDAVLPDLLLLDILMPEMDGCQVAQALQNHPQWQRIPIIILSVVTDEDRVRRIPARAFVSKPFKNAVLLETIRQVLAGKAGEPHGSP